MKIEVHLDPDVMAKVAAASAAQILRDAIKRRGKAAFVAATGVSQFNFLKSLVAAPGIAWERTTMFHLDEYIGMSADHPASFRRYLRERLTSKVPIGTVHFIAGDAPDLTAELEQLSRAITSAAIDAAFVGIGENGYHAFNDPPADFETERPYIYRDVGRCLPPAAVRRGVVQDVGRRAANDTVEKLAQAITFHTGQVCCDATRWLVHQSIYDRFAEELRPEDHADLRGDPQQQLPMRRAHYVTLRFPYGRTGDGLDVSLSPRMRVRVTGFMRDVPYDESLQKILTQRRLPDRIMDGDDRKSVQRVSTYVIVRTLMRLGG